MIVNDLNFFEKILDKDTINLYIRLSNSEDKNVFSLDTFTISQQLNKTFKYTNKDHYRCLFWIIGNAFIYKLNCLFHFIEKNENLEEAIVLSKKAYKLEKECLKILKKTLSFSQKRTINLEHNDNISKTFLYISALYNKMNIINTYFKQQLITNESNAKGFYINFPTNYDIEKDITDIQTIISHTKKLKIK